MTLYMRILSILFLVIPLAMSCSSTEPLVDGEDRDRDRPRMPYIDIPDEAIDEFVLENLDEFEQMLYLNRSRLSDQFTLIEHDLPEHFTREAVQDDYFDPFQGFRVQILSTRDVAHADTTRDHFMAWADTTLHGYQPDSYVHFRQPYYRVRVGDFHDREQAIEFSRLIKAHYPDAWVVHDRVHPAAVPSDTTEFRFIRPEDRLQPIDE
jgi:hypothetical protein